MSKNMTAVYCTLTCGRQLYIEIPKRVICSNDFMHKLIKVQELILCIKLDICYIRLGSHVDNKILVPRFVMSQEPIYRT